MYDFYEETRRIRFHDDVESFATLFSLNESSIDTLYTDTNPQISPSSTPQHPSPPTPATP